jgi:hypothetical protein
MTIGDVSAIQWATFVIAALGAGFGGLIAYRQWRTAQTRLRIDLFERRLDVYEAVMYFAGSVLNYSKFVDDADKTFLNKTRSARWLFGKEFADFLMERFYKAGVRIHIVTGTFETLDTVEERKGAVDQQMRAKERLTDAMTELQELAAPFLEFEGV